MGKYKPVRKNFVAVKKFLLSDEKAQQEYDNLEEEFLLIAEMLRARKRAKKTQQEVAKLMNTTSSAVSRLESLERKHVPSLETLRRYAAAVGCYLLIRFVPKHGEKSS